MKLHAGVRRTWPTSTSSCKEAGVETRRGSRTVARADARHRADGDRSGRVPDRAVWTAADPGHRTDTMSSHDTAAPDADQDERSADVGTGGRDEPAELVLGRLEARMAESRLRAHIYLYLTERTVVEFATRRTRTDRPLERNVGPEPVRRVLAALLRPETKPRSWLTRLHAVAAGQSRVLAPTLWNSPALMVTAGLDEAPLFQSVGLAGRWTKAKRAHWILPCGCAVEVLRERLSGFAGRGARRATRSWCWRPFAARRSTPRPSRSWSAHSPSRPCRTASALVPRQAAERGPFEAAPARHRQPDRGGLRAPGPASATGKKDGLPAAPVTLALNG